MYHLARYADEEDTPIGAMPGCYRLGWRHGLVEEVSKARDVGVNSIVLFPKVLNTLKVINTDVALDLYSSDGHNGIVTEDGKTTLSTMHAERARAGADVVSPSDMMDGRIGAIQVALDDNGFQHVSIMSYTVNPANYRKVLVETREDESEGADILLVKPGLPYLDIIRLLRDNSHLPIAAYQVSRLYSMNKAGGVLKMIDEERVMMESLMCLRRAGVDIILSYFALQTARYLRGEKR
ncbi:Delta-aminolevulinic acid dehydratase 1 [Forsythia ovata]|uniref:Delta-aminolevulinic acid dehydratase n=1 Tax=Forsythia ovata TaxID=205694 RepID=A0ABD1U5P3_9LAMI